jgi:translation initiation factor IF-1
MSKDDLLTINGKVSNHLGGGVYHVLLENGVQVNARLCGKMKKFRIRVAVGDDVSVGLSPYDKTHGLILRRHNRLA